MPPQPIFQSPADNWLTIGRTSSRFAAALLRALDLISIPIRGLFLRRARRNNGGGQSKWSLSNSRFWSETLAAELREPVSLKSCPVV